MDTTAFNMEDNRFKFSLNNQNFDDELLDQHLPEWNNSSLEDLRARESNQQFPITYKEYHDSDCYEDEDTSIGPSHISTRFLSGVVFAFTTCVMIFAFSSMLKDMIEANIMIDNINNNRSVSIFTPDKVLYIESYTFDNNTFVGFVRKGISFSKS